MRSFMLWQRDAQSRVGIASDRRVLRAAEVPALLRAQELLDELHHLAADEQRRVSAACDEARAEGLAQGLADAQAQSRAEVDDEIARLARAHEHLRQRLQHDVAALALDVFQKLLGQLPADERLARLALQAARELLPARTWRLHVHPSQLGSLRAALQAVDPGDQAGLAGAEILADTELADGDCRLTTEFGTADAGLATQVQRLARHWTSQP
ncbi:FliH/SctL family protein [Roseateles asaccharophilus]|uniref:Flagellar assembly protein FliH n=1 Tax=Roseateles asaccharophilus TaxID=582607 RepID=A0ABU2A878_9BURK|nr:FliH/SctL family protein [Roseateles asaccharophilus]MDR7333397.1 flagellar biosynthesis/type III secretory pathway protein FliH [Roseateles asaccharophilus]